jgi:methylmalonyl-CoA mutase
VAAIAALPRIRLAEPFERLRDASDRMLAKTGQRPKIFIANLGRLSDFGARASFAKNFFAAGGIEAVTNEAFANLAAMVEAFTASDARLACLCASDDVYAREAVDAAKALKAAGAQHIFMAGRQKEPETYTAVGVHQFIYVGCDALATLEGAHEILGLTA